ncbi:MAG: hypothetical protein HYZ21_02255 [Chloroflexi bacterium]|nr:hypothetical protein [Chloroflexota bacterium]
MRNKTMLPDVFLRSGSKPPSFAEHPVGGGDLRDKSCAGDGAGSNLAP